MQMLPIWLNFSKTCITSNTLFFFFFGNQHLKIKFWFFFSYLQILVHFCGSHVLQTFIEVIPPFLEAQTEFRQRLENIIIDLCQQVSGDLDNLITNNYSSHVLRYLLRLLRGNTKQDSSSSTTSKLIEFKAPDSFKEQFEVIQNKILELDLVNLAYHSSASPFLQVIVPGNISKIICVHSKVVLELMEDPQLMLDAILTLKSSQPQEQIESLITDTIGSRMMEIVFKVFSQFHFALNLIIFEGLLEGFVFSVVH